MKDDNVDVHPKFLLIVYICAQCTYNAIAAFANQIRGLHCHAIRSPYSDV